MDAGCICPGFAGRISFSSVSVSIHSGLIAKWKRAFRMSSMVATRGQPGLAKGIATQRSWATSPVSPLAIANSADPDHFSPGGIPLVWRAHGMCVEFTTARARGGG